jgi:hypothetical protein
MSAKYPAEGEETGATAESTTPYIHREGVEGGQDPVRPGQPAPTQPGQPDEDNGEDESKPGRAG